MLVKIKLIEDGKMPFYATKEAACADCYARITDIEGIKLKAGERCLINLGFALELPERYEAILRPRSGNTKRGIDIGIGTIDSDYRGELKACLINNSKGDFEVHNGDRICQLKIQKAEQWKFEQVDELTTTERGANGFGSTGM